MSFKISTRGFFLIIAIISITAWVIIQSYTIEHNQTVKKSSNISLPIDEKTLINVSVMVIFCIGFTFTYMIEGFPNFAHTSYAVIGSMVSFYLTRFLRINPYYTWGLATIFGGVIGIIFYRNFIEQDPEKQNLSRVVDHIEHACEVAGEDHVGFGSDYDGIGTSIAMPPSFIETPQLTQLMLDRSFSEEVILKFWDGNFLRLLTEVENYAE